MPRKLGAEANWLRATHVYAVVPGTLSGIQEFPSIDVAMVGNSPAAIHSSKQT